MYIDVHNVHQWFPQQGIGLYPFGGNQTKQTDPRFIVCQSGRQTHSIKQQVDDMLRTC